MNALQTDMKLLRDEPRKQTARALDELILSQALSCIGMHTEAIVTSVGCGQKDVANSFAVSRNKPWLSVL